MISNSRKIVKQYEKEEKKKVFLQDWINRILKFKGQLFSELFTKPKSGSGKWWERKNKNPN